MAIEHPQKSCEKARWEEKYLIVFFNAEPRRYASLIGFDSMFEVQTQ